MFQLILGFLVIIAGIVLGVWLGVWVCFVGGIVDVITSFQNFDIDTFPALQFAWGLAKMAISAFVGWGSFLICTVFGGSLIATSNALD